MKFIFRLLFSVSMALLTTITVAMGAIVQPTLNCCVDLKSKAEMNYSNTELNYKSSVLAGKISNSELPAKINSKSVNSLGHHHSMNPQSISHHPVAPHNHKSHSKGQSEKHHNEHSQDCHSHSSVRCCTQLDLIATVSTQFLNRSQQAEKYLLSHEVFKQEPDLEGPFQPPRAV